MSYMKDKIRTSGDLGRAVRKLREDTGMRTADIAVKSGRSRDVLNRLEKGSDVSLSSVLAILGAMAYGLEFVRLGPPTLKEMQERTRRELDEGEDDGQ